MDVCEIKMYDNPPRESRVYNILSHLDIAADWSDHALWWPTRNCWLSRTRSTLDQYGVQADALLHFTPMHKTLRVQLPDLRYLDCRVDFSVKTFNAVVTLCKELGIRHPEELSFAKPLESDDLRYNYRERESITSHKKRSAANTSADTNTFIGHHGNSTHSSNNSLDNIKATSGCTPVLPNTTINRSPAPVPTPISSPVNVSLAYTYIVYTLFLLLLFFSHRDNSTNHHYNLIHQVGHVAEEFTVFNSG